MNVPLTPVRFLRHAVTQFPRNRAVVCGGLRLNYKEFSERAGRLAAALAAMGVRPGDRVAFLSTNCHRLLEAYYGVLEAGAVLLPLNIRLAPEELSFILNDAGARVLFLERDFLPIAEKFRSSVQTVESYLLLDGEPEASSISSLLRRENYETLIGAAQPHHPDIMEFDEDSVAELFYTSGSTADPKGVMLTHRNIYLHALSVSLAVGYTERSVQLHTIPLFHANGWGLAHSLTLAGAVHVMLQRFDPAEVLRLVEAERVEGMNLVPTMGAALVNSPEREKYDLGSMKRVILGGAAASPTLVREMEEKLGCLCHAGYGLTETSPVLSLGQPKKETPLEGEDRFRRLAMAGFAIPGVELAVMDEDGHPLPHDGKSMGEIVARSDVIMEGYWKRPQETEKAFRGGWFHTGDMGVIDAEQYVQILDRKKDIIVSGGENISSLEVEKVMLAHPAVYEVAVIPVPDQRWGEVPKALVVLKPEVQATESELLDFVRPHLAGYKVPKSVEFCVELPKGGTGKILKKELRKKYWPQKVEAK